MGRNIDPYWVRKASHHDNRVSASRASVDIHATIKQLDLSGFPSLLQNLSESGFRLSCPAQLNPEQALTVKMPGLQLLGARIMWVDNDQYGCKFDQPLYPAVFDHIVRMATGG